MKLTDNLFFYPEKGTLDCNTYVIRDEISLIIDPGFTQFLPKLIQDLHQDGIEPQDIEIITNTHLHVDHYCANEAFKEISGAKILAHPLHKKFYDITTIQTAQFFGLQPIAFKEDGYLENSKQNKADWELEFVVSPGHSPDSICFYSKEGKFLICGDVIFNANTGRADLPGSNANELKHSIEELSQLNIEYLLPGHMDIITSTQKVNSNFTFVKENVFGWL